MKTYKLYISVLITLLSFSTVIYSQSPQWTVQHSGLPNSLNPTLILSAVDSNVCWGVQGSIFVPVVNPKCILTTDGGIHWSVMDIPVITGSFLQPCSIAGIDSHTAYIAIQDSSLGTGDGIFKTTDGGITWTKQTTAFPGAGGWPNRVYFFDTVNGLCTGEVRNGYWEIYTTSDGGTNWIRVPSSSIPAPGEGDIGGEGVASGNSFWFNTGSCSAYHTTDRGLTWSVKQFIFPTPAFFLDLAFKDTLNGLSISYFGDDINKLSKTSDGGENWTRLSAPDSPPSTEGITYVPGTSGSYIVTSMSNKGYPEPTTPGSTYTPDGGITWIKVDNQAHGSTVFVNNKTGWSAGCGDTIFKWNGFPLGINPHSQLNNTAALSQNYPNPFYSTTSIQFQIPSSSKVILKVFDIQGSEVATLVNDEKSAGSYNVNFDSWGLRSGIYYYRLQVGESVQTKKLCIL